MMQLGKTSTACILFAQFRLSLPAPPHLSPVLRLILGAQETSRAAACTMRLAPSRAQGAQERSARPPKPKVVGLQLSSAPHAGSQGLERNDSGKP